MTWPLMHIFYAFVNYLFAWFYCYNSYEIKNKRGHNLILVSFKFLKVFFFFSFTFIPLKIVSEHCCRNWTYSWGAVIRETCHLIFETLMMFIYFSWFEKKYTGFRIFYKDTLFN